MRTDCPIRFGICLKNLNHHYTHHNKPLRHPHVKVIGWCAFATDCCMSRNCEGANGGYYYFHLRI
jgi:hypothetical protein